MRYKVLTTVPPWNSQHFTLEVTFLSYLLLVCRNATDFIYRFHTTLLKFLFILNNLFITLLSGPKKISLRYCVAETNTMLQSNYPPIKIKEKTTEALEDAPFLQRGFYFFLQVDRVPVITLIFCFKVCFILFLQ